MKTNSKTTILTGTMITAGSAIGAGMFSLPFVASGMWIFWTVISMIFIWSLNYLSALYVLEANMIFDPGASFDTISLKILGRTWNILIGLFVAFLMYILLYAYFSAFGSILSLLFESSGFEFNEWLTSFLRLFFGLLLAVIVWLGTKAVGRISTLLVIGMTITFLLSISGYSIQADWVKLMDSGGGSKFNYIWAALPYFMTSFGFVTVVPSLYKYYGKEPKKIKNSLLVGSLITFAVYLIFIYAAFGNISRLDFVEINKGGGNISDLIIAFTKEDSNRFLSSSLTMFSNFAIISSFIGVGLGLFDFIADKFSLSNDRKGRFYAACLTFLPPGIASFFFPNGFISAIGYAGLVMIFAFFVAPFFMSIKLRKTDKLKSFKVFGGLPLLYFFFFGSVMMGVFKILGMLGYLESW